MEQHHKIVKNQESRGLKMVKIPTSLVEAVIVTTGTVVASIIGSKKSSEKDSRSKKRGKSRRK